MGKGVFLENSREPVSKKFLFHDLLKSSPDLDGVFSVLNFKVNGTFLIVLILPVGRIILLLSDVPSLIIGHSPGLPWGSTIFIFAVFSGFGIT